MVFHKIKRSLLMPFSLIFIISALSITVHVQQLRKAYLIQELDKLRSEKFSAEATTRNVIRTTLLLQDLGRATAEDNQVRQKESEQRVVVIRQMVKDNHCASRPVPRDAADRLRAHRNQIR